MANYGVSHYGAGSYLRNVLEPLIGSSTNSTEEQTLRLANAPAGGFTKPALPEWPSRGVGRSFTFRFSLFVIGSSNFVMKSILLPISPKGIYFR
jgi:hypothetical protein